LGRFDVERLEQFFSERNVPTKPLELDRLTLDKIRQWLFGFELISDSISAKWGDIGNFRNEIVHELKNPDLIDKKTC
jgi:hypothetical protein